MDKRELADIQGVVKQIDCLGCAREKGEIDLGHIVKSKYFDAHQDYEIPIPGFVIISSRRHIQSVDEFTQEERNDFMEFLCNIRKTMRTAFNIQVVYLVQEENTSHHFHVWVFPRYDWMKEKFGVKVESMRPIMEYARETMKTEDNLKMVNGAIGQMKEYFEKEFII